MKILIVLALIACVSANRLPQAFRRNEWVMQPRWDVDDDDKIVGGSNANAGEFPFIISFRQEQSDWWSGSVTQFHFCGGTIIGSKKVVTAAHCVADFSSVNGLTVAGGQRKKGSDSDDGTEQVRSLSKISSHGSYSSSTTNYDFAVLTLSSGFSLGTYVDDISMSSVNVGQKVWVAGWGALSEGGSSPNILQKLQISVLSNSDCNSKYSGKITSVMVCAGHLNQAGEDSCQGDSGGPLTIGTGRSAKLVGVVSWGYGCARKGYPGVYARVSSVTSWINSQ